MCHAHEVDSIGPCALPQVLDGIRLLQGCVQVYVLLCIVVIHRGLGGVFVREHASV